MREIENRFSRTLTPITWPLNNSFILKFESTVDLTVAVEDDGLRRQTTDDNDD